MRNLWFIISMIAFSLSLSSFGSDKVLLARPLGTYPDKAWTDATSLEVETYRRLVGGAFQGLYIDRGDHRHGDGISIADQFTLVETELRRVLQSRDGEIVGIDIYPSVSSWERYGLFPTISKPNDIYRALKSKFPSNGMGGPGNPYVDGVARTYDSMQGLVTRFQFLLIVLERELVLKSRDGNSWDPIVDLAYRIVRKELIRMDREIKVVANQDEQGADSLATGIIAILLGSDESRREEIFFRLFDRLQESLTLRVRADRHLTRFVVFLHERVLTPARKTAFWSAAVLFVALSFQNLIGSDEAQMVHSAEMLKWSFTAWVALFVENMLPRLGFTAIGRIADEGLNRIRGLFNKSSEGHLARLIRLSTEQLANRCSWIANPAK